MTNESAACPPMNHVFVDFENVRSVELSAVGRSNFVFHLFLGPNNVKLDVDLVDRLLASSQSVKLIRSPKPGKNALDFVLAYHLGQAVQSEPKAKFHLVSQDAGFDALVELLKTRQVKVKRYVDWQWVKQIQHPAVGNPPEPKSPVKEAGLSASAAKLQLSLSMNGKNRPKKKKTLVNRAKDAMGKDTTDEQAEAVVAELITLGWPKIDEKGNVSYVKN